MSGTSIIARIFVPLRQLIRYIKLGPGSWTLRKLVNMSLIFKMDRDEIIYHCIKGIRKTNNNYENEKAGIFRKKMYVISKVGAHTWIFLLLCILSAT